jgi:hypothetical protein
MSLYREPSGRSTKAIVAAVLGAVACLAIGFAAGRATAPDPSLEARLDDLREDAREAGDGFELVAIHYGAANDVTREAAQSQLDRAEASFGEIEDELALVDPSGTRAARTAIATLSSLVAAGAPAAEVERAAEDARSAVRAAAGDDSA